MTTNKQLAREAEALGQTKFEGSVCIRCGRTTRYVNGHHCVACMAVRSAKHRAENRDLLNLRKKIWSEQNKEYKSLYNKAWYQRNKAAKAAAMAAGNASAV